MEFSEDLVIKKLYSLLLIFNGKLNLEVFNNVTYKQIGDEITFYIRKNNSDIFKENEHYQVFFKMLSLIHSVIIKEDEENFSFKIYSINDKNIILSFIICMYLEKITDVIIQNFSCSYCCLRRLEFVVCQQAMKCNITFKPNATQYKFESLEFEYNFIKRAYCFPNNIKIKNNKSLFEIIYKYFQLIKITK